MKLLPYDEAIKEYAEKKKENYFEVCQGLILLFLAFFECLCYQLLKLVTSRNFFFDSK